MMKNILLISALLFMHFAHGQEDQYCTFFGGILNETPADIVQTSETTFTVLATTGSNEPNQSNFYLVELDTALNYNWSTHLGSSESDVAASMIKNEDNELLLFGTTNGYDAEAYDFLLMNTDLSGNINWTMNYGGDNWELAKEIISHPDGGYLLFGETYSFGNGASDLLLIHVDEDGNEVWTQTYGGSLEDEAGDILIYEGDKIALCSSSKSFNEFGVYQMGVLILDLNGDVLYEGYYGFENNRANCMDIFNDQLVIAGSVETEEGFTQNFMMGLENDYTVDWIGGTPWSENNQHFDVLYDDNHFYAVGENTASGNGSTNLYLYRGNSVGYWTSSDTYGSEMNDYGRRLMIDDQNNLVVLGTFSQVTNENTDILVFRIPLGAIDFDGEEMCTNVLIDEAIPVEEVEYSSENFVFPNPSSGDVVISNPQGKWDRAEIYTSDGRMIQNFALQNKPTTLTLSPGMYIIQLTGESRSSTQKLLVQ